MGIGSVDMNSDDQEKANYSSSSYLCYQLPIYIADLVSSWSGLAAGRKSSTLIKCAPCGRSPVLLQGLSPDHQSVLGGATCHRALNSRSVRKHSVRVQPGAHPQTLSFALAQTEAA